jgi:hypothetical protein
MDALPPKFAARPDPHAVASRPAQVAGAVAAKLRQVYPVDAPEEVGSDFDRECRAKLARFEQGQR